MDANRFDTMTRQFSGDLSRRRIVGGVLAGAMALLLGTSTLQAKPGGNGQAKGKSKREAATLEAEPAGNGNGQAKGKTKTMICHYAAGEDTYKVLTLGNPGAQNHLRKHEHDTLYVDCCSDDECEAAAVCFTATCDEGECTENFAEMGDPCITEGEEAGTCDGAGACNSPSQEA